MRWIVPLVALLLGNLAHATCLDYAEQPGWIVDVPLPAEADDFASSGSVVYAVTGGPLLQVLDLAAPGGAALLSPVTLPDNAHAVSVSGSVAHVACSSAGLVVLDLSTPTAPTVAGSYVTASPASRVASLGSTAFVAAGSEVVLVDTSTLSTPAFLSSIPVTGNRLAAAGDRLVVHQGLRMVSYDITVQTAPLEEGFLDLFPGDVYYGEWFRDLAIDANTAFALVNFTSCNDFNCWDGSSIRVYDLTPTGPVFRSSQSITGQHADGLALGTDAIFAVAPLFGAAAFDYTDLDDLTRGHHLATTGDATALYVVEDSGSSTVLIGRKLGTQPIAQCVEATHLDRKNYGAGPSNVARMHGIVEFGDYAYAHDYYNDGNTGQEYSQLSHWGLADPDNPNQLSWINTFGLLMEDIELAGNDLYLCVSWELFRSAVGTPGTAPSSLQIVPTTTDGLSDLEGTASHLYVAHHGGFLVFDVSAPGPPVVLTDVTTYDTDAIAVDGTRGCTLGGGQLRELDLTDPANPSFGASTGTLGEWVELQDNIALVSDRYWLRVFEIDGGITPRGTFPLPGKRTSGELDLPLAYVGVEGYGLLALDLTDLDAPSLIGSVAMDLVYETRVGTGRILLGESDEVLVLPPACLVGLAAPSAGPATVKRIAGFPNPFRTATTWRWTGTEVRSADVLDVAGRRVSSLSIDQDGGTATWDGRGDAGQAAPAGVYFVRFETEAGPVTSKIVRTR